MAIYWLYPTYRVPMLRMIALLLLLGGIELLAIFLPGWPAKRDVAIYLPLHTLLETISIIISIMVFAVGWNSNNAKQSGNVALTLTFLIVGSLDFFHAISYVGMPDVFTPNDIQKHLYFWLPARLLATFSLVFIAIESRQFYVSHLARYLLLTCLIGLTLGYGSIVIYHQASLPDMFVIGQGLSPLKKGLEYFIMMVNLATALLLLARMRKLQAINVVYLFGASCTMAMSEYFFAIYTSMNGSYNILGHIYKVVAYLLIYRAIVTEVIDAPYKLLKTSKEALLIIKKQYDRLVSNIPIGVHLLRTTPEKVFTFEYASPQFYNLFNVSEIEMRLGSEAHLKHVIPEDRDEWLKLRQEALQTGKSFSWEGKVLVDREISWMRVESHSDKQANGDYLWDGVVIDITETKNNQYAILKEQANHDHLTKLPNRRLFMDRLEQEIKRSRRGRQSTVLFYIDLDRFKEINDTQGHDAGDIMLIEVAERIKSSVRDHDTVARIGGDEFAIILGENFQQADIERIAKDINLVLAKPFEIQGKTSYISGSIGIATYPQDGVTTRDLVKSADQAMYEAKSNGGGHSRFYTPTMQEALELRVRLSNALHTALSLEQLEIYYQPIANLTQGSITKAEALMRWNHPELGQIAPSVFIPLAEDTGLIHEIGEWMLEQVILHSNKIKSEIGIQIQISVNVSPLQFKRHSNDDWIDKLRTADLLNRSIVLEITEGLLLTKTDNIIERLRQLRRAGIPISIDDFGTGYSSFSYLKDLPLDYLKIDQSFIQNLTLSDKNIALCEAIIILSKKLGLTVIAEGIETSGQLDILKEMGCEFGQGYLLSRPIPFLNFYELLKKDCPLSICQKITH